MAQQWAVHCCEWAIYWAQDGVAGAKPRLTPPSLELLLSVADSQQRIAAALCSGAPAGQPGSGGAGAGGEGGAAVLLRRAGANLLHLASTRLDTRHSHAPEPIPWEPWQRCLASLTLLLRGLAWEAEQRGKAKPPTAPAVEVEEHEQKAWRASCDIAEALLRQLDKPGCVPAAEAPAVVAAVAELARVLVRPSGDAFE